MTVWEVVLLKVRVLPGEIELYCEVLQYQGVLQH